MVIVSIEYWERKMSKLHVDPLAIYALIGFGSLIIVCLGLTAWVVMKAMTAKPVNTPVKTEDS